MKKFKLLLLLFVFSTPLLFAQDAVQEEEEITEEDIAYWNHVRDSIESTFNYQYGQVKLLGGDVVIDVPDNFKFLDAEQSKYVLTTLWGNPEEPVEGMLFPKDITPISDNFTYAIEIAYSDEGYIKDEDAKDIDYDELLEEMQSDIEASNPERAKLGYPQMELVNWASPPFYDEQTKKLHWAKELKFEDSESNTLNYNIRILGRKGYLTLNAIGEMNILDAFKGDVDDIIGAVHFTEGNTYADFDSSIDKVAAYGIGGLIAGKVLAKAGFFAVLAKFGKFIIVGIIAFFAGIRKFLFGGKKEDEPVTHEEEPTE